MTLNIELPQPINEELSQDSQREGISEMEHAALLLCLASTFNQEEANTPFQEAVRDFLFQHSLDAERVFSVFEELVRVCAEVHDAGKAHSSFQEKLAKAVAHRNFELLKHWRDSFVHQTSPLDTPEQAQGRTNRKVDDAKEAIDPRDRVNALLAQWQAADSTPLRPPIPTRPGETPTQALFRKWEEEDANMTDEEREAEDRLWEEIQQSLNGERTKTGMRTLF
jgi:hypothetical protein